MTDTEVSDNSQRLQGKLLPPHWGLHNIDE